MKILKSTALVLFFALIISSLFACAPVSETVTTYDEAQTNALRAKVAGKWTLSEFTVGSETYSFEEYCEKENANPEEQAISFTFNEDGTGEGTFGKNKTSLTFLFDGTLVTVTTENGSTGFNYDKAKDAFFIYDENSNTYGYLTRQ